MIDRRPYEPTVSRNEGGSKRSRNTASDIIRIDRFDQREILGRAIRVLPVLRMPARSAGPVLASNDMRGPIFRWSGIEGRVVDLVFAMMERARRAEGVGEKVGLPVQALAAEPQQATEVCRCHHEDGLAWSQSSRSTWRGQCPLASMPQCLSIASAGWLIHSPANRPADRAGSSACRWR